MELMLILVSLSPVLESPPEPASQNLRLLGACENAYFATSFKLGHSWFDGVPFRINTTNMAGALPILGVYNLGACEVAGSLQARLAGSHGF